ASVDQDALIVVDIQEALLGAIYESARMLTRAAFLIKAAGLAGIPILATEQVPDRLGRTDAGIREALGSVEPLAKSSFSAAPVLCDRLESLGRPSVVLVGIETHICVCSTVLELLNAGFEVTTCADAVSSRSLEAHKLGMERIRDSGSRAAHTES